MSESTAIAESSSAPVVQTVELPRSGTSEYASWRISGELPETPQEKPNTEDSAPSQVDDGEATAPKQQEHTEKRRRPDAEARIKELAAETKRLRAELDEVRKPKAQEPPKAAEPQYTRPKPAVDDKTSDGKPKYNTYEDYVEELADWKAEQRMVAAEAKRAHEAQVAKVQEKVQEAKSRYENFDEYSAPFVKEMIETQEIPMAVKVMVSESEVWPDLVFTIASNAEDRAAFLQLAKNQPGKALRYIAKVEGLIQEQLENGGKARAADGKFTAPKPPAKRGTESTPEPPLELNGRGTVVDEAARALSALKGGTDPNATRAWLRAENAKDLRRRRGV